MKRNPGALQHRASQAAAVAIVVLGSAALWLHFKPQLGFQRILHFAKPGPLQLWYWQHTNLVSDQAVREAETLIDKAAGFGYTGVAFWDSSFNRLGDPTWPQLNVERLRDVLHYAANRGLRVMTLAAPFGWSNAALIANGNLAESQRVTGAQFEVDTAGRRLRFLNSLPPLRNAGFEGDTSDWFGTHDAGLGLSSEVSHSGRHSALVIDSRGNSRYRQEVKLRPWRQYHISIWVRSQGFRGPANLEVVDWWHRNVVPFYTELPVEGTKDWTKLDFAFDSRDTTSAYLYFGVWGNSSGIVWFDDVSLEETALVYVERRAGAPLRVSDAGSGVVYREGRDYDRVFDPALSPPHVVFRDSYHEPVTVTLPPGSAMRPGQHVLIDYYAVFPIPVSNQVGMCLTDESVFRWIRRNTQALKAIVPSDAEVLLSYDEMRQMNSCASCRARHLSAGQLLAWNTDKVTGITERLLPGRELYVWNDMFDPFQNARPNFYYVEGNLSGSWKGLKREVEILNWNRGRLAESLRWFSGLDARQETPHAQIIASYYDCGYGGVAAGDLAKANGIPGVKGLMYVSWRDDYGQLRSFAESARAGWNSYVGNVPAMNSSARPN